MKLQRYGQFVKKINEERQSEFRNTFPEEMTTRMPKDKDSFDSVSDFRREMDLDSDDEFDTDRFSKFSDDDTYPDTELPGDDMSTFDEEEDDFSDDDDEFADDSESDWQDDSSEGEPMVPSEAPTSSFDDETDMPDYSSDEQKLHDLAKMLGVEVVDNQVTFGDEVVNYYSETGNLHIGSKEFETAKDAAEFLKGGEPRMVRDQNESRSYRFRRNRRF